MINEKESISNKVTPALIIGLGGTGQSVLTDLKKNLIESYGQVPRPIQLLAFDTTTSEPEVAKNVLSSAAEQIGDYRLKSREEFVYLDGDVKELCLKAIANPDDYNHITSWFQVNRYLDELSDDDFNLARGAGTRRDFGRLAIFYNFKEVKEKIKFSLQSIKSRLREKKTVEICIVSSLAGGTGSGMFIDVAHLARVTANEIGLPRIAIRGFFMLHNAFQTVAENRAARLNTYAALLELERFMVLFGRSNVYPINYLPPNNLAGQTFYESKLFDSCFLVDAERENHSLSHLPPQKTLYPAIADCITTLLDPVSGDTYQQHYKNVNNRAATAQKEKQVAMYSSFGTYAYILPVSSIIREFELRFVTEFLKQHFAMLPVDTSSDSFSYEGNSNSIEQDASSFLRQNLSPSGLLNTPFVQGATLHLERNRNNLIYVEQLANSVYEKSVYEELLDLLRVFSEDGAASDFTQNIDYALRSLVLQNAVRTSEELEDPLENAARRIPEQIQSLKRTYLGELGQNGERQGMLRQAFANSVQFSGKRFQELLTEKLLDILTNNSSVKYGDSRLGYARAFIDHLSVIFDEFHTLLERVQRKQNQSGHIASARDEVRIMGAQLEETKDSNIFPYLGKRKAVGTQKAYIAAEQELINLQITETIINELINQARMHQRIIQAALDELNQWFAVLVSGDPLNDEKGILPQSLAELDRWKQFRQQQEINPREQNEVHLRYYLTDPMYEEAIYQKHAQEQHEAFLERFQWSCTMTKSGFKIELKLDNQLCSKELNGSASTNNLERLLASVSPYFSDIKQESAIGRLAEGYSPENLASKIWDIDTFISFQTVDPVASKVEKRIFISLNESKDVAYKENLKSTLPSGAKSFDSIQIVSSYDPYKCMILSTTDMIGIATIPTIQQVEAEYNQLDAALRSRLHIFPAEVNAVNYEARLGGPGLQKEEIRHFTARVKSLFEDEEKLRLFVQALATGVIREEDSSEIRLYKQYVLRVLPQVDQLSDIPLGRSWRKPPLFEAIYNFVYARPLRPLQSKERVVASVNGRTDGQAYATLSQINEAIELREELIRYDLTGLTNEIIRFIGNNYRDLRSHRFALESRIAALLVRNVRKLHEMNLNQLVQEVIPWLVEQEKYDELVPRSYYEEIAQGIGQIILKLPAPIDRPARLQRHLHKFTKEICVQLDINKPEERDLATIFEIILGDYRRTLANR